MLKKFIEIFKKSKNVETEAEYCIEDKINDMFNSLNIESIELILGEDFIKFKDTILKIISDFRDEIKETYGFIFPAIHVMSNEELQENEFILKIQNSEVFQEFSIPNEENIKKDIENALKYIYENHLDSIFTIEIAEKYLNTVQLKQAWGIWNLSCMYSIVEIRDVLLNILKNKKSIKNINFIFDKIIQYTLESGFCYHYSSNKIAKEIIKCI